MPLIVSVRSTYFQKLPLWGNFNRWSNCGPAVMDALLTGLSGSKIIGMSLGSPRCKEYEHMCDYNTVIKIPVVQLVLYNFRECGKILKSHRTYHLTRVLGSVKTSTLSAQP